MAFDLTPSAAGGRPVAARRRAFRRAGVSVLLVLAVGPVASAGAARPASMPGAHQHFATWRGGERDLPDHTVFRPANLKAVPFKLPVVVWGNGGCRDSNEEFRYFLTTFASYGVLVIANGAPENPYNATDWTKLVDPKPELLTAGITWAEKVNADRRSPYFQRVDTKRVLVMGQSCGGWEAMDASSDPRVKATISWNSSLDPQNPNGVKQLHAPILYVHGGTIDHVSALTEQTYGMTDERAVLASNPEGGHVNWWDDPSEGPRPSALQRVPGPIAAQWMAFTLYSSKSAGSYFLGDGCGLCSRPGWTVTSKNWS